MALYNRIDRKVDAKIVYFGPVSGGKETSITEIYRSLPPGARSSFKSVSRQEGRVLFFDFTPEDQEIAGYALRLHLYTVVDDAHDSSIWEMVFNGADGIVFVADSDPDRQQENQSRLKTLHSVLSQKEEGSRIPFVIQYNRRDTPDAPDLEEMQRHLNPDNVPGFPSVAITGEGIMPPFQSIVRMILARVSEELPQAFAGSGEITGASTEIKVHGADEEIILRIAGEAEISDSRLTVPVMAAAGTTQQKFQLVISLEKG